MAETALGQGTRGVGLPHAADEEKPIQETIWKLTQLLLSAFTPGD